MPPPTDYWPIDTNPYHAIPRPPLSVVRIEGRFPHRGARGLKTEDLHVQVETGWEPGVVLVRLDLDDDERSDFWMQLAFKLTPPPDDADALARLADDGCPHAE